MIESCLFGMTIHMKTVGQRITHLRENVLRLTQEDLAKELGVTRGAVGNWELDKGISRKNIEAISTKWSVSPDWLLAGKGRAPGEPLEPLDDVTLAAIEDDQARGAAYVAEIKREANLPRPGASRYKDVWLKSLPIVGEVAAGSWLEPAALIEDSDSLECLSGLMAPPAMQDEMFAVRIRGTSVNKIAADGDFAVCLRADDAMAGDLVIAERIREQGGLRERTVKRLQGSGPTRRLNPESTDPLWQTSLVLGETEDEVVRIIARVLYIVKDASRRH